MSSLSLTPHLRKAPALGASGRKEQATQLLFAPPLAPDLGASSCPVCLLHVGLSSAPAAPAMPPTQTSDSTTPTLCQASGSGNTRSRREPFLVLPQGPIIKSCFSYLCCSHCCGFFLSQSLSSFLCLNPYFIFISIFFWSFFCLEQHP